MKPIISIIVPIYNVEKYLSRCLTSLVNQTMKEIEVICVNDGSPDQSQKIIDQFVADYPETVVSVVKQNGGLADARNFGLNYAKGEYVLFIDSDDWVTEDMCEKMYQLLKKIGADLVVCDLNNVYEDGRIERVSCGNFECGNVASNSALLTIDNSACNKLFKKSLFDEIKFPVGIWYEDLGCIPMILAKATKMVKINEPFYQYFQREGSIMNTYSSKSLEIYTALGLIKDFFNGEYQEEVEYLYIKNLMFYGCSRQLNVKNAKGYLNEAAEFMHKNFPNWLENKYLQSYSPKDRFILKLYSRKQFWVVRGLLSMKRVLKKGLK